MQKEYEIERELSGRGRKNISGDMHMMMGVFNFFNIYGGCGTLVAVVAFLILLLVCRRKRFFSTSSPYTSVLVSDSINSNLRTSKFVTDADLKFLKEILDEKLNEGDKWEDVIDKRNHHLCYNAKCCKPKNGPLRYLSVTIFNDISSEMLRNFYLDNDYRKQWDNTLVEHNQLQLDESEGVEVGHTVKKFPLLKPREYVLAWKLWEGRDNTFYCFMKECEHPLAPRQRKYVRVEFFRSGWQIRKVPGRNACEITMFHQEDAGLNMEMAKLAFSKGIWNYVCKMDNALRRYSVIGCPLSSSVTTSVNLIQKAIALPLVQTLALLHQLVELQSLQHMALLQLLLEVQHSSGQDIITLAREQLPHLLLLHTSSPASKSMEVSSQPTLTGKRHQRTRDEDKNLVDCLLELAACKMWTGDNGTFKPGYTKQLEQWLHQKMPGCGLKASPHIESRVKHLKKQYGAIADMLKASGFGWNDQQKMIVVEKNVFDDWVKSHPNAQGLFKKSFPHFDDLALVYGKDRATGIDAEDPGDAFEAIDKETEEYASFMGDDVNIDEAPIDSVAETQLPQSPSHYSTHTVLVLQMAKILHLMQGERGRELQALILSLDNL